MTDNYDLLSRRASVGIEGFDDEDLDMFEKFCQFLDATGEEWGLGQIKTKFSQDDLRFYVTGNQRVQALATALERYWFDKYKPEYYDPND